MHGAWLAIPAHGQLSTPAGEQRVRVARTYTNTVQTTNGGGDREWRRPSAQAGAWSCDRGGHRGRHGRPTRAMVRRAACFLRPWRELGLDGKQEIGWARERRGAPQFARRQTGTARSSGHAVRCSLCCLWCARSLPYPLHLHRCLPLLLMTQTMATVIPFPYCRCPVAEMAGDVAPRGPPHNLDSPQIADARRTLKHQEKS